MAELEKVIKAIEIHTSTDDAIGCNTCAYENDGWCINEVTCLTKLLTDVLELLKEQQKAIEDAYHDGYLAGYDAKKPKLKKNMESYRKY